MAGPDRRRDCTSQAARHCRRVRANAALWRKGAGYLGLLPRSRRLAHGIYELWRYEMTEAPGTHNPQFLPPGIPVPQDDGAARHLAGARIADVALPATEGAPGVDPPDGWDQIPGARGCTPQSCSFRDHFGELKRLGVAQLYGLSTQDTAYQREAATRLHLPFAILSDEKLALTKALKLPTFSAAGMTLLKRMALVIDDGTITKAFYPVFPPDKNAEEVIAWLQRSR